MGNTRLSLRSHGLSSSRAWAPNGLMTGTRAPMRANVACQVCIIILLQHDILLFVSYPRSHAVMGGRFDIAYEAA
eukprot:7523671-Pyramimonas_sp.AAC.1